MSFRIVKRINMVAFAFMAKKEGANNENGALYTHPLTLAFARQKWYWFQP
jgi:hypothetical protein